MASPPDALLADEALGYAETALAYALWRPVGKDDTDPFNYMLAEDRRLWAGGMSKGRYYQALRKLIARGWITAWKGAIPSIGRPIVGAVRLHFDGSRPSGLDSSSSPLHVQPAPPGSAAGDTDGSRFGPRVVQPAAPILDDGSNGKKRNLPPPPSPVVREIRVRDPEPARMAKAAEHFFHELDMARRQLASELGPSWDRIRSARLAQHRTEHHDNLAFAVDADGLERVTAVVTWGWREAAAGRRAVPHQVGTFSGSGEAYRRLSEAYDRAHGGHRDTPDIPDEIDGVKLSCRDRWVWEAWISRGPEEATRQVIEQRKAAT